MSPPLFDRSIIDEVRAVDDTEARDMAWRPVKDEGIFAGTSTGMNAGGAYALARELGPDHTAVTVAVDSGISYPTVTCTDERLIDDQARCTTAGSKTALGGQEHCELSVGSHASSARSWGFCPSCEQVA